MSPLLPQDSDHGIVIFHLRTKEITDNPKYHLTDIWEKAHSMDLELLASCNPFIQQIWPNRDNHETWKLLWDDIEDISNTLAPTEVVQHRSNFQPYMNDEIQDLGEQVKLKFNHAVTTGHYYDWDDHNKGKSVYQKALNLAKNQIGYSIN